MGVGITADANQPFEQRRCELEIRPDEESDSQTSEDEETTIGSPPVKLAWLTDVHLNCVTDEYLVASLIEEVESQHASAVLIGGDIGEAPDFIEHLEVLSTGITAPIYFVLGNHDYYRGSIAEVRQAACALTHNSDQLRWLPEMGVVSLSDQTTLVGHGGWGDARVGDFLRSQVILNDYLLIAELQRTHGFPEHDEILTKHLMARLQELGDEAAAHFRRVLPQALEISRHVVVLMHVPPFHDACWHNGRRSDHNWSPHFVCEAVGVVLKEFMQRHPHHRMTVLCGHTHSPGRAQILHNLEAITGGATYGAPQAQAALEAP